MSHPGILHGETAVRSAGQTLHYSAMSGYYQLPSSEGSAIPLEHSKTDIETVSVEYPDDFGLGSEPEPRRTILEAIAETFTQLDGHISESVWNSNVNIARQDVLRAAPEIKGSVTLERALDAISPCPTLHGVLVGDGEIFALTSQGGATLVTSVMPSRVEKIAVCPLPQQGTPRVAAAVLCGNVIVLILISMRQMVECGQLPLPKPMKSCSTTVGISTDREQWLLEFPNANPEFLAFSSFRGQQLGILRTGPFFVRTVISMAQQSLSRASLSLDRVGSAVGLPDVSNLESPDLDETKATVFSESASVGQLLWHTIDTGDLTIPLSFNHCIVDSPVINRAASFVCVAICQDSVILVRISPHDPPVVRHIQSGPIDSHLLLSDRQLLLICGNGVLTGINIASSTPYLLVDLPLPPVQLIQGSSDCLCHAVLTGGELYSIVLSDENITMTELDFSVSNDYDERLSLAREYVLFEPQTDLLTPCKYLCSKPFCGLSFAYRQDCGLVAYLGHTNRVLARFGAFCDDSVVFCGSSGVMLLQKLPGSDSTTGDFDSGFNLGELDTSEVQEVSSPSTADKKSKRGGKKKPQPVGLEVETQTPPFPDEEEQDARTTYQVVFFKLFDLITRAHPTLAELHDVTDCTLDELLDVAQRADLAKADLQSLLQDYFPSLVRVLNFGQASPEALKARPQRSSIPKPVRTPRSQPVIRSNPVSRVGSRPVSSGTAGTSGSTGTAAPVSEKDSFSADHEQEKLSSFVLHFIQCQFEEAQAIESRLIGSLKEFAMSVEQS